MRNVIFEENMPKESRYPPVEISQTKLRAQFHTPIFTDDDWHVVESPDTAYRFCRNIEMFLKIIPPAQRGYIMVAVELKTNADKKFLSAVFSMATHKPMKAFAGDLYKVNFYRRNIGEGNFAARDVRNIFEVGDLKIFILGKNLVETWQFVTEMES